MLMMVNYYNHFEYVHNSSSCLVLDSRIRLVSLQFFIIRYVPYTFPMCKFYVVFRIQVFGRHYFYSLVFTANSTFKLNQSHSSMLYSATSTLSFSLGYSSEHRFILPALLPKGLHLSPVSSL